MCNFCSPNPDSDSRKCKTCFKFPQVNGGLDIDLEEEIIGRHQENRRIILEDSDSEENNYEPENDSDVEEFSFRTIEDESGRPHVPYPANGKSYVFFKSNTYVPSTIEGHCNDLINIFKTDKEMEGKKGLVLILDDGADYGIR